MIKNPEYRKHCKSCDFDCLKEEIKDYKRVRNGNMFPVCPGCGEYRVKHKEFPGTYISVIFSYAKEKNNACIP